MKKKTRRVKARCLYTDGLPTKPYPCRMLYAKQDGNTPMSVFVLPATPEAWDAMVEMGAKAMFEANLKQELSLNGGVGFWLPWEKKTEPGKDNYRDQSRAVLTALALVRPTQKGGA